jgi:hypothetical protein
MLRRPLQPVKVFCVRLVLDTWCGNMALQLCMLSINRLRASCWFDYIQSLRNHRNGVQSRSEMEILKGRRKRERGLRKESLSVLKPAVVIVP